MMRICFYFDSIEWIEIRVPSFFVDGSTEQNIF